MFQNTHAEEAPPLKENEERWYLSSFGVYHPRKPGNIHVVFDSSTQHGGVSLNNVLLTGPDLNNTLLGVLIRFREEAVAITADIQQMYHCFLVREEDRNFLRFLWFKDNNPSKDIVEYRMRVHVFGNCPSPAVAIYCLRQSVLDADPDVKQFVNHNFYVDDGLKSFPTVEAAADLLKRTQEVLLETNLRLHKIASNKKEVMEAFPSEDHDNDLKDLDLGSDVLPTQRSLGLNWNLMSDTFTFNVAKEEKPFTRQGVLSTVNSIYDPLGFIGRHHSRQSNPARAYAGQRRLGLATPSRDGRDVEHLAILIEGFNQSPDSKDILRNLSRKGITQRAYCLLRCLHKSNWVSCLH